MAIEAVALIAVALLVAASQWMFTQTVARVDVQLIPATSRRRVEWLVVNSAHIYLAAAGTAGAVVVVQAAVLVA
jgi:hypothetical protein